MALFSFFKRPRHQQFTYHPRYYDPRKERLEKILENAKNEGSADPELIKSRISDSFRRRGKSPSGYSREVRRRSNILLLAIIVVLLTATYLLLTVYLPRFVDKIG